VSVSESDAGTPQVRGGTIHNILVVAEKHEVGPCLEEVLRDQGYGVTTEDSFISGTFGGEQVHLVIATNTSMTPSQIRTIIPDIKSQLPNARILVLSGFSDDAWVADLQLQGIDGFLTLPFELEVLVKGVAGLLPGHHS
jgi:DNA-binding NarL/FixJ family response regulator